jgi:hypothetical protein
MISRYRNILKLVALLTALCVMQIYVFAETTNSATLTAPGVATSPQTSGTLRTTGAQPITVNGNSVTPGTTILSGSTIETPTGVGATINLGSLGSVDLAPNTRVVLEFSNGQIKVNLTQGCLILRHKSGVYAEIDNAQGKLAASDPNPTTAGALDVCQQPGAPAAIINQGAAANAGAGAGTGAGAAAAGPGINRTLLAVLLLGGGGGLAAVLFAAGGSNPSTSTP